MQVRTSTAAVPSAPAQEQEFAFDERDFARVCALIHQQAGISLNTSKRSMVYSRLSRRLRATAKASFKVYLDALETSPPGAPEWQNFINALTTNLTSFFREQHHFPLLTEHLRRLAAHKPLRIWCCAASTGEEPYSLAMTAMEAFDSLTPPVSILATDIDTNVLAAARTGVYAADGAQRLDTRLLKRYFLRGTGANANKVRVRPELGALIDFQPLNLLHERWPFDTRFHAIFCRNVMIYFDKPTQHDVLRRLARHVTPDGLLFAGHSENFGFARELFELRGQTVYRPSAGDAPAGGTPAPRPARKMPR
jgi:chemotaxis protein methyltransferase CheR